MCWGWRMVTDLLAFYVVTTSYTNSTGRCSTEYMAMVMQAMAEDAAELAGWLRDRSQVVARSPHRSSQK